ncbi:hypothetical protein KIPB_016862 [Kipferlia bialata]|uniref:Uncharacterized protein n=1 Tax=Kipferlia bialata TaxID=797122 RepID=A0A391P033_9EUKA|nr:hypothetical protein KIPB_016862 [Kipferlia bialata]|eukprot:g16862.t1
MFLGRRVLTGEADTEGEGDHGAESEGPCDIVSSLMDWYRRFNPSGWDGEGPCSGMYPAATSVCQCAGGPRRPQHAPSPPCECLCFLYMCPCPPYDMRGYCPYPTCCQCSGCAYSYSPCCMYHCPCPMCTQLCPTVPCTCGCPYSGPYPGAYGHSDDKANILLV